MERSRLKRTLGWFGSVLRDKVFYLGLLGIIVGLAAFAVLFNYAVMPLWTRHDAAVSVPDVREMTEEQAESTLRSAGLGAEMREQPFNPNLAADIVVEQQPDPSTTVKPGRRVYFYVNASPKELAVTPNVTTLAEATARAQLREAGLVVGTVESDTIRTPFRNTVTRQAPQGGRQVPKGTRVALWTSPGPGSASVRVPNVVGNTPEEAREIIRRGGLWVDSPNATGDRIRWQQPDEGATLREGEEVRISTNPSGG
ncbi:MAG: PASTA domain-containing protein [Bacteroidota bacterium]